jgi:molecular chaperone DnaJ
MDFYVILGLEHGATESDIKRAYRRMARRYHPDINPGDRMAELRFRQILEAYETLIDPARRSRYEAGHGPAPQEPRRSGFEGFDFSAQGSDHSVTFGDLFAEVLIERGAQGQPQARGADLHQEVVLSFEEAYTGVSKPVSLTRRESCRTCAGTGVVRGSGVNCLVCQGAGSVRSVRGHMVFSRRCAACGGSGQQRPVSCEPCSGTGQIVRAETINVGIPAGVADGDRVRVEGQGDGGLRGGAAGDLYLTVRVAPHAVFRREGADVHIVIGVAVHEAALGARIDVPAPDGRARLRVPPGTQSGQRFRLRERGMPSLRGETRGDLIVEVHLRLPAILDERSKELLREFGRLNGEGERALQATPDTAVRPIIVGAPAEGPTGPAAQAPDDLA